MTKRKDLLDLQSLSAEEITYLLNTAQSFKEVVVRPVKKVPTLRGKSVATLFFEPSTRTRTSFEHAAKIMSADTYSLAAATSSATKGESLKDTMLTLDAMGIDAFIIRHPMSGAAELASKYVPHKAIINAGDGTHEHPTQGLLDLLTVREAKGQIAGLTVAIVGDILHSRVARSNLWGLHALGAKVRWVGPATLMPVDAASLPVEVHTNLRSGLEGADVVNVLRIQLERQDSAFFPSVREYARLFGVNKDALRIAAPDVIVLHPGPMNRGVEISSALADDAGVALITNQVTNGVCGADGRFVLADGSDFGGESIQLSTARILRFLAGSVIAAILLAIILPFAGVPSSKFLPPGHVWGKAQGYARGMIVDKYYDLTNDPFHTGDEQYFVDYQFSAKPMVASGQPAKPQTYKGTVRVDHEAYTAIKRPDADKNNTYKAKDPIPVAPGLTVRVKYETTYPDINGVTQIYSNGAWVNWGGRSIGPGSANFSGWLIWVILALVIGYFFMLLLEKFAAQENI